MKKSHRKLYSVLLLITSLSNAPLFAQSDNDWTGKKAEQWYNKMEWLNGFPAKPSETINKEEFAKRYHANKAAWDKAFAFLKNTDFTRLRPGKYPIDEEQVFATSSEGSPREMANTKWEAHLTYTDIHFVVKGNPIITF